MGDGALVPHSQEGKLNHPPGLQGAGERRFECARGPACKLRLRPPPVPVRASAQDPLPAETATADRPRKRKKRIARSAFEPYRRE
jgi:hypothetical protein